MTGRGEKKTTGNDRRRHSGGMLNGDVMNMVVSQPCGTAREQPRGRAQGHRKTTRGERQIAVARVGGWSRSQYRRPSRRGWGTRPRVATGTATNAPPGTLLGELSASAVGSHGQRWDMRVWRRTRVRTGTAPNATPGTSPGGCTASTVEMPGWCRELRGRDGEPSSGWKG